MTISIRTIHVFNGPNIWNRSPVTVAFTDLGDLTQLSATAIARLASQLTAFVPSLEDPDSYATPLGPVAFTPVRSIAELCGLLAINLQRMHEVPVVFAAVGAITVDGLVPIVVEHRHEEIGRASCRLAVRLLNHLVVEPDPGLEIKQEFHLRFGSLVASRRYGAGAQSVIDHATMRGIPVSLIDPTGRLVELGTGAYRKRFMLSRTSNTSALGADITNDKHLTNHYLGSAGLPVPDGLVAKRVQQAIEAANEIGFPVALKPIDQGASAGLALDLRSNDEVREAFLIASAETPTGKVLIEPYLSGNEYRVTIINRQIVAVGHHIPAFVVGDGSSAIRMLIERENRDPRRGRRERDALRPIVIDRETERVLARQHLVPDSIPDAGQFVRLELTGKIGTGGISVDVTDWVHPENSAIFLQAAAVAGLDIVTLDVVASDIAQSMRVTGGVILELNVGSGFHNVLYPGEGVSRDPAPAILDMLYPAGSPVRAPIVAITGDGAQTICALIAEMMGRAGQVVGVATREGVTLQGIRVRSEDGRNPTSVGILLNNAATEILIVEIDQDVVPSAGYGFDYCDLALVTSLSGLSDAQGLPIERLLTGLVGAGGSLVLNDDEPGVRNLAIGSTARPHSYGAPGSAENGPDSSSPFLAATAAGLALGLPIELIRQVIHEFSG